MTKLWMRVLIAVYVILGILPQYIEGKPNEELHFDYESWQNPRSYLAKFTFFVCNNPDIFTSLNDIDFVEKGPYVYEVTTSKQNIELYDDEISYLENKSYKFRQDLSNGLNENDTVTIVNFPTMGIAFNDGLDSISPLMRAIFPQLVPKLLPDQNKLLFNVKVEEILFTGVQLDVFKMLIPLSDGLITSDRYSIYDGKTLLEPKWTINNGKYSADDIGQITHFQDQTFLTNVKMHDEPTTKVWMNDTHAHHCNKLRGTDGQFFKPNLEKGDTIYTFEPQLCRSVFYRYWKESVVKGIDTYRFRVPPEYFHSPLVNSDNACYCNRNIALCDRNGVTDISHCQYQTLGAPLIMSDPYWNNGDRSLRQQFKSELKPRNELNDENYGIYLDIEPITGKTLQMHKRMQMSIRMSGRDEEAFKLYYPQLANTDKSIEYIVPVYWLEEVH